MSTGTEAASHPDVQNDHRLDPHIKRALHNVPWRPLSDIDRHERLVEISDSESALAMTAELENLCARFDAADVAPFDGLRIGTREFAHRRRTATPSRCSSSVPTATTSSPASCTSIAEHADGLMLRRPVPDAAHVLVHQGLAVAMVDFPDCLTPSSAASRAVPSWRERLCRRMSWTMANAVELGVDPDGVVVAGESGGGNLALATGMRLLRDGDMGPSVACTRCARTSPAAGPRSGSRHRSRTKASSSTCATIAARSLGIGRSTPGMPWLADVRHRRRCARLGAHVISVDEADRCARGHRLLSVAAACRRQRACRVGRHVAPDGHVAAELPDVATQTAASIAGRPHLRQHRRAAGADRDSSSS